VSNRPGALQAGRGRWPHCRWRNRPQEVIAELWGSLLGSAKLTGVDQPSAVGESTVCTALAPVRSQGLWQWAARKPAVTTRSLSIENDQRLRGLSIHNRDCAGKRQPAMVCRQVPHMGETGCLLAAAHSAVASVEQPSVNDDETSINESTEAAGPWFSRARKTLLEDRSPVVGGDDDAWKMRLRSVRGGRRCWPCGDAVCQRLHRDRVAQLALLDLTGA